jgi:proteasome accessory factor B
MLSWGGLWYVLAFDFDAQAERTFLLKRIISVPARVPQKTHPRPAENYVRRMQSELEELTRANSATLNLISGSDAQLRLTSKYGYSSEETSITFGYSDLELLADELVVYGNQVSVVSPSELTEAVRTRLELISSQHGGEQ